MLIADSTDKNQYTGDAVSRSTRARASRTSAVLDIGDPVLVLLQHPHVMQRRVEDLLELVFPALRDHVEMPAGVFEIASGPLGLCADLFALSVDQSLKSLEPPIDPLESAVHLAFELASELGDGHPLPGGAHHSIVAHAMTMPDREEADTGQESPKTTR
ncbi:MAG: hypothetical protein A3G76_01860 [Acidobacteria bacterium RIFCSPLOWO2_12_FULL_65_11]|nr:MAG: hypothetical protein A3H95_03765 [Acidobacteria bacterium RIFCSPLOWO2_02_FULL_64_15]OFW30463.1 MAG: hypothetical protein A3G76_01860 [Acidobacteria bacterium RIFCSPLOWO2_12_FULL_65_11]